MRTAYIPFLLAFAAAAAACSSQECKSTGDCDGSLVCRNGRCVEPDVIAPASDDTGAAQDTGTATAPSTGSETAVGSDSAQDTAQDTASVDTQTAGSTDSGPVHCGADWQCNDDNPCTQDACDAGVCTHGAVDPLPAGCCDADGQCDDTDPCTVDQCDTAGFRCVHSLDINGVCCTEHIHCDDSDACTVDWCTTEGRCAHTGDPTVPGCCRDVNDCAASSCAQPECVDFACAYTPVEPLLPGCCATDEDCAPVEGACLENVCDATKQCRVQVADAPGCCAQDADCEDGNPCTQDACGPDHQCAHGPAVPLPPTCCASDGDCDDSDPCTADSCVAGACQRSAPDPLPAGCCAADDDCNDFNDCTRDVCSSGHCFSGPDPSLGPACCAVSEDCDDGNPCSVDVCDTYDFRCAATAPDTDALPSGCCTVDAHCADPTNPCVVGTCGFSPRWTCVTSQAPEGMPCDDGSWCNGAEVCTGGACVTLEGSVPCNGPLGPCREGSCDEQNHTCTVVAEYDTDVSCDDGLFCNGEDVCSAGDCIHRNPPCANRDTDTLDVCEEYVCDEDADACAVAAVPDFTPCDNGLQCDGYNLCVAGVCESSAYCTSGSDCITTVCEEDSDGGTPTCITQVAADGTPCAAPDLGACFGSQGRVCVDGVCSIGTDPMCPISGGFCKDYLCVEAWGPGTFPDGGCGEDTTDYRFDALGCTPPDTSTDVSTDLATDTDTGAPENTVHFSTALERDKVADYGACASGLAGADIPYSMALTAGQTIDVAVADLKTTGSADVHLLVLSDACTPSSCAASGVGAVTFTAPSDGTYYIVVDKTDGFAAGTLVVTCR